MEDSMEVEIVPAAGTNDGNNRDEAWNVASATASAAILEDLENQYVGFKKERDNLQVQLEEAHGKLAELNKAIAQQQELEVQVNKYKCEIEVANTKLDTVNTEQKLSKELIDRQQSEIDSLKDEVSRLTEKNNDLAKKIAEFEIESKLTASEAVPLFYEKQRLESEVTSLQTHSNFLEQELSSKSKQYQHLQRESRDRTIQLQLQLDQTISEKDALAARLSALEKIERKLQDKVNQLSLDNLNGKQEVTTITQKYEVELQEERRIVSLQKEHLDRWQKRYEDVVKENENLKSTASQALVLSEKELENERNLLEQKYTTLLNEQAAEYESKIQSMTIAGTPRSATRLLALPPSTNVDVDLAEDQEEEDVGLLSMTDLFQRLEETKSMLRKEQTDRKCWQLRFAQIQKQIRESAPQLIRQREEYEIAIDQLSDYQRRLEVALSERDDAMKQAAEARTAAVKLQTRLADRQAESQELAKQVQALLVSISSGGAASTSISDNIPTSIQQMQSQNQRLLSEHRRLTQKVAELEEMINADETRNQLEIKESAMLKLQKETEEQERLVERIVQQRDLYRALLAKHDSNLLGSEGDEVTALELTKQQSVRVKKLETLNVELEGTIKKLRLEREKSVAEKDDVSARLKNHEVHSADLMKTLEKLEQDLMTARSNEARVACEAQYHKDHCERLESSLERARSEIGHLNNARSELQRINTELQQVLSNVNAERGGLESEKRQVENRLHLLQAQIETTKLTEKRVTEENRQLRSEVARQGSLIDSIRRIEASIVSNSDAEKEGLRNEKESLVKRLAEEVSRHKVEAENWNARILQLEATVQDHATSREKIERRAVESNLKLTEALAEVEKLTKHQQSLEFLLAAARKRLGEADSDSIEEITSQAKIQKLEAELDAAKDEISSLKENSETYKKIAKDSETSLAELQTHINDFQSEKKGEVEKLTKDLEFHISNNESKDELIRELTNDLANQRDEREKAISGLKATIAALETELENKVKDADLAKANAAVLVHDMEALRDEVKTAQLNFERELALHSQARTALRAAREEVDQQTQLKQTAEEKLREIGSELNDTKRLLEEDKLLTKKEIDQLEKRVKDANEQNEILHTQLESLTRIVDKIQAEKISNVGAQSDTSVSLAEIDHQKIISELREVVKFLRSENAIIQTQLDTAKRVADRERAAANVVRRSLEEAQVELKAVKESGDIENTKSVGDIDRKLLASEEQVQLLKDSNKLLREEIDKLESQLSTVQSEADEARKSAEPVQNAERELNSKLASLEAEKQSLTRELETWKNRVKTLVSKFHQIDPEEHKKLIAQVTELQKEKESLNAWKKATEEESNRIRSIAKTLNQKNRDQKTTIDAQQKDLEKLNAEKSSWASASTVSAANAKELTEVKEKVAKMVTEAESMKRELDGANSRNDRLREKLREFQTMIRELRAKEKALTAQLEAAKAKTEAGEVKDAATQSEATSTPSDVKGAKSDETGSQNDPTIPAVPQGGFKFGPSESSRVQAEKQTEQKPQLESSLRPTATTFIPTVLSADKTVGSVEKKDQEAVGTSSKDAIVEMPAESSPSVPTNRSSATNKELSMKEILLAKKMKLQEALKRKQEAENQKQESTAPSAENSPKRAKVDKPPEEAKTSIERESTPPPSSRVDYAAVAVVTVLEPTKEADEENEPEAINVDADAEKGPEDSGENPASAQSAAPFVFSRPVSNPFAAFPTSGSQAAGTTIFGQSSSVVGPQPITFGSSAVQSDDTASKDGSSTGGAFLDIKPPGSSATPPVFTFGSSSKITLPTPSLPPPANPFGTFGSTTSFGSFGAPTGGIMPSIPLFGSSASVLPQDEKTEENSGDVDE